MRAARHARGMAGVSAAVLLLLLGAACSQPEPAAPDTALPEGAILGGDAEAFRRLLAGLEQLRGSSLGRAAGVLRGRLAPCKEFSAALVTTDAIHLRDLFDTASCDRGPLENPALRSLRGTSDLVFLLPVGSQGRVAGSARVDDAGSLVVEAEFLELPSGHFARLLAPGLAAAGPRRLNDEHALISARVRPEGGLDLASLVPAGSQADQMFRLKSEIFQGAALSGAWEFALYPPAEGRAMPLLALSLDVRLRSAAVAGIREFIAELESTWPVHHRDAMFGEYEGACFFDLRILPEFAPCYADTPDAIVIGWNPEAIRLGLARPRDAGGLDVAAAAAAPAEFGEHAAELVVRFGELPAADERLRAVLAPDAAPLQLDYFWDRLALVSGRRDSAGRPVWLRGQLRAASPAAAAVAGSAGAEGARAAGAADPAAGEPS